MQNLSLSLKAFGLNPSEWNINRLEGSDYIVRHKFDQGFEFRGQVEYRNLKPCWKFLRLWSI